MIKSEFSHYRPPGPKPKVPYLFGLKFLKDPLTILNDLATRYGDICYIDGLAYRSIRIVIAIYRPKLAYQNLQIT
jgi:hypothetical protein